MINEIVDNVNRKKNSRRFHIIPVQVEKNYFFLCLYYSKINDFFLTVLLIQIKVDFYVLFCDWHVRRMLLLLSRLVSLCAFVHNSNSILEIYMTIVLLKLIVKYYVIMYYCLISGFFFFKWSNNPTIGN
jgi:hypothetical protein